MFFFGEDISVAPHREPSRERRVSIKTDGIFYQGVETSSASNSWANFSMVKGFEIAPLKPY